MQNQLLPNSHTTKNHAHDQQHPDLRDQDLLYKTLMQSPAFICILKGLDFQIIFANKSFKNFFGDRFHTGQTLLDALPELQSQGFIDILKNVFETKEPFCRKEMPLEIENNSEKKLAFINLDCEPYYDNENRLQGVSVFAYDVSEQVNARNTIRESERKYQELIYGLPIALYKCDANGKLELYNQAAVKLWGEETKIGTDVYTGSWQLFNQDGTQVPEDKIPVIQALQHGIIDNSPLIIKRSDGTQSHLIPYPQPFYTSGKITGVINTLIDITEQVEARRQLERTGEMIHSLYMNAPAFICTFKGPEFVYDLVNPQYQKIFGKRKLRGLRIIDALPELKDSEIPSILRQVYETGNPFVATEMQLLLARDEGKDLEEIYFNFSYQPMYNINHEIDGILVFGYEVTNQVLAKKKSEENLRSLLESLPQITSASSEDGTNIFFNKFFFEYSGLSVEEATKDGWNSILHPDDYGKVLSHWEECKREGKEFIMEIRLRRKSDGIYRWHIARITPVLDENQNVSQWIASATDIHEQKIKEERKDDFMSIASHEMKTPLTTVKAYLQLLEITVDPNDADAMLYTKKAIASVERLKDLISELLDVSKIQHGQLNYSFSNFDFNEMIDDAVDDIQYNSPNHTIIKTGKIDSEIFGDKERLQQVVVNLLSNAVKYSPQSKEVFISVSNSNDKILVSVQDTGIGIASNNFHKIFERYFRIEGQQLHFQGLGIGLYISMNIIQRHKGKIWVESEAGKGSTFFIELPFK
jgi:PAS domain S-box-containing protein